MGYSLISKKMLFALAIVAPLGAQGASWIINGSDVPAGSFTEVIRFTNSTDCTGVVVGPRTILTAGHCAGTGETVSFSVNGTSYTATMTRSPLYQSKNHDMSLGITTTDIQGVKPASIGGSASVGLGLQMLGYGCASADAPDSDRKLRQGNTVITGLQGYEMISRQAGGAVLCFGDSGGPAYVSVGGKLRVLGVHTSTNLVDTNHDVRMDTSDSQSFFQTFASSTGATICGVNIDCDNPTPVKKPSCDLTAAPSSITLGQPVTLQIVTHGQVTSASIEGVSVSFPTGTLSVTPSSAGSFTAHGTVKGPGGSNSCQATYVVKDNTPGAPTCSLTAVPDDIKLGESVTLQVTVRGQATSATIDGTPVNIPFGKKIVTPASKGNFTSIALVQGPGGSGSCSTNFRVDDQINPPDVPNYAVVPTYCGANNLPQTGVASVCLGIVKRDQTIPDLRLTQVVIVTFTDNTKEVLPVIHQDAVPTSHGTVLFRQGLTLYANSSVTATNYQVLDTRSATLSLLIQGSTQGVPTAIEGRTSRGSYFLVPTLSQKALE